MNHLSLELPPSDTLFYPSASSMDTPFFYSSLSLSSRLPIDDDSDHSSSNNLNDATSSSTRDPMFEKLLTPSDVGKLNRLVIPKQHAEKYFPLSAASPSPVDGGSAGVLLAFEDECAKCWRFRYSYWNSSQSYVLTKGWSRFVKEKKLDAGDVVLFERHRFEPDRFFIGWRRRGALTHPPPITRAEFVGWSGGDQRSSSSYNALAHQGYAAPQPHRIHAASFPYLPVDSFHAGTEVKQERQKAGRSSGANSKRLRLFGVNLECQLQEEEDAEPQTSDGSSLSSQSLSLGPLVPIRHNFFEYMGYPHPHPHPHPNHHNHMEDVKQMRNGL